MTNQANVPCVEVSVSRKSGDDLYNIKAFMPCNDKDEMVMQADILTAAMAGVLAKYTVAKVFNEPVQQPRDNMQAMAQTDVCNKCGAPMKLSHKSGKMFCSALCWTKK